MPFTTDVLDNYTSADTDPTYGTPLITDHYADTGQRVVINASGFTGAVAFKNNRIYFPTASPLTLGYVAAAAADGAKSTVNLQILSNLGSLLVGARMTNDNNTGYFFGPVAGKLRLYRLNTGTFTNLFEVNYTPTTGAHTLSITPTGTGATVTLHCEIDGVAAFADFADTSVDRLTALGNVGLYGDGGSTGTYPTATTGIHVESLQRDVPTVATVPNAPTIGTATVTGPTSVSVAGTAPGSDGGSAITSYTATSTPGSITGTGSSLPIAVTGLTTSTVYTFKLTATNGVGTSAASAASNSVTPVASASAISVSGPTTGTAGSASSNFTVSANGPITGTVVVTPAATGCTFTPTTVSISSGSPTGTFTVNAAAAGAKTISFTNNGGLTNQANLTYTAAAASAPVTITSPSLGGKYITNGAQRATVACNVTALDKSTHAVLERKTGLTSSSTGVVSYTSTALAAGIERLFIVKADADDKDLGTFFATPV